MNASPSKRIYTNEIRDSAVASNMQNNGLPDELAARLMNIGARVRKSQILASKWSNKVLTRSYIGVTEGYPSVTPTPHTSPVKWTSTGTFPFTPGTNPIGNNLFSSYASVSPFAHFPVSSGISPLKRRREEEPDADIRLRMQRPMHGSDMSADEDTESDDDLDIITCSSDSDKVSNRPIRPLRKTSHGPRALSGLSTVNPGSFSSDSGAVFSEVPTSKDCFEEDEIMTVLN